MPDRPPPTEPWELTIAEAATELRARRLSARELLDATLDRITAVEPRIQAFVRVYEEPARAAADAADHEIAASGPRSPLHGIPIGVKDLFDVAGDPTSGGRRGADVSPAALDAAAVERLREAGCVILGKTVTHELAYGVVSPPTRNPWLLDAIPGGSSGGSAAALAARLCSGALGTDTGGSVRVPAALTGTVGLKPTYGRISKRGVLPLSWSLDHVGPMARTVTDVALLLDALAGHDPLDAASLNVPVQPFASQLAAAPHDLRSVRIGVPTDGCFTAGSADVAAAFATAVEQLRGLGGTVYEVSVPHVELSTAASLAIIVAEAAAAHQSAWRAQPTDFGTSVRLRLQAGELLPASYYLKAQRVRTMLREGMRQVFRAVDVLVMPTVPYPAARQRQHDFERADGTTESVLHAYGRSSHPLNLAGLPALSVPIGLDPAGLPIGMQIAAPPLAESSVLYVGRAYEQSTPWHLRRPEL